MYVVGDWVKGSVGNLSFGDWSNPLSGQSCTAPPYWPPSPSVIPLLQRFISTKDPTTLSLTLSMSSFVYPLSRPTQPTDKITMLIESSPPRHHPTLFPPMESHITTAAPKVIYVFVFVIDTITQIALVILVRLVWAGCIGWTDRGGGGGMLPNAALKSIPWIYTNVSGIPEKPGWTSVHLYNIV